MIRVTDLFICHIVQVSYNLFHLYHHQRHHQACLIVIVTISIVGITSMAIASNITIFIVIVCIIDLLISSSPLSLLTASLIFIICS